MLSTFRTVLILDPYHAQQSHCLCHTKISTFANVQHSQVWHITAHFQLIHTQTHSLGSDFKRWTVLTEPPGQDWTGTYSKFQGLTLHSWFCPLCMGMALETIVIRRSLSVVLGLCSGFMPDSLWKKDMLDLCLVPFCWIHLDTTLWHTSFHVEGISPCYTTDKLDGKALEN